MRPVPRRQRQRAGQLDALAEDRHVGRVPVEALAQDMGLEEVIVTAEFRSTPLLQQPVSTTVLTSQDIQQRAAQHLEEIPRRIGELEPEVSLPHRDRLRLRAELLKRLRQFFDERGFLEVDFCSMDITGLRPVILSTSGLSMLPRNCRA